MKLDNSLEKAAIKFAEADGWGDVSQSGIFVRSAVRFAQRHGAKVRRETLKEFAEKECNCRTLAGNLNGGKHRTWCRRNKILTPRGPEKGRHK